MLLSIVLFTIVFVLLPSSLYLFFFFFKMNELRRRFLTRDDWVRITCRLTPGKTLPFLQSAHLLSSSMNDETELHNAKSEIKNEIPLIWGSNPHLQNFYSSILRSNPKVHYRREVIPDPLYQEPICLDWVVSDKDQDKEKEEEEEQNAGDDNENTRPTRPTLIILPGVTGASTSSYINHFVQHFRHKYRIVVYTRPGCDENTPLTHYQIRLNAHSDTIHAILNHVDGTSHGRSPLLVASFSMGGQNIAKYLANYGERANGNLIGSLAICNPFDTSATVHGIARDYPLIDRVMTENMKKIVWRNRELFESLERTMIESVSQSSSPTTTTTKDETAATIATATATATTTIESPERLDIKGLKSVKSMRELDLKLTKHLHNFKSVEDEYYAPTSVSQEDLGRIRRRIVFLHADDDPVVRMEHVPNQVVPNNDNVIFLSTSHGSHCSYASTTTASVITSTGTNQHCPSSSSMTTLLSCILPRQQSFMEQLGEHILAAFVATNK